VSSQMPNRRASASRVRLAVALNEGASSSAAWRISAVSMSGTLTQGTGISASTGCNQVAFLLFRLLLTEPCSILPM